MASKDSGRENRKVLKFWIFWVLGFFPLTLAMESSVSDHNMEMKNYLKKLNKPYVKSIKSPNGEIIDCVPINRQPALDNPLLKNHTIQMRPSSYPKGFPTKLSSNEKPVTQLWQTNGRCPEGTVPIRRTREEDLLRARSFQSYGKKTPGTIPNPYSPPSGQANAEEHEHAIRFVNGGEFYGAKATMNVWNPSVQEEGEFSLAQMWILAGDFDDDLNTIEAGWQVCYNLYGDYDTHLFGYWTSDSYRDTGCYNMICDAFVQTDMDLTLGAALSPTSSYDGYQNHLTLLIYMDRQSGHWWLQVGDKAIGYWPDHLFTHLRDFGTTVEWGGEVVNAVAGGEHTTTEMGSGRFSEEGFKKAASFIDIRIVDESNEITTPDNIITRLTRSECYDLTSGRNDDWGEFFFFGGPGRNPNCP